MVVQKRGGQMSLINLFKSKNNEMNQQLSIKYGGIIRQLNLEEFWETLSEKEKNIVRQVCKRSYGFSSFNLHQVDSFDSDLTTRRDPSSFLLGIGIWTFEMGKYNLTEKILLKAIEIAKDISTVHASYIWLIKIHDKLRKSNKNSIDKCIFYCNNDIAIVPLLIEEKDRTNKNNINLFPFNVLVSIYKELGKNDECENIQKLHQYYKSII
ncbi:hypothetical protein [Bacillus sp. PS06]|uniref:hypothetical protein n=1 Tax=Bacillus sp. PS06 TaxID=2764176 RepID=UPI00178589D5|nr:hypothetical protein [Bacillus sp. PS06]MBD8070541.1 hypothetical protein [Bacillus sp. PS06]